MSFYDLVRHAQDQIVIVGTNALIPYLEQSAEFFADLLTVNENLQLSILYESDSENFNQSLSVDTEFSTNRSSYSALSLHRDRIISSGVTGGITTEIRSLMNTDQRTSHLSNRVRLRQVNLRLPVSLILADDALWYCLVTHNLPTIDSYRQVDSSDSLYSELREYVDFLSNPAKGGVFLSQPQEELIQLYDKQGYPRGIFPRAAFYTTDFQRYSIWGFVFNRKGSIMLHQRSKQTKDNRLLWDKSIGGHVDLRDYSSTGTAKRELVEELFLPEAEYTRYVRADLGDIVDFGDWNPKKRPERHYKLAFSELGASDWILFRATDADGDPLTVTRVSPRRIHTSEDNVVVKRTVFMSDVYFFISPAEFLDTPEQMKKLMSIAEETGAAADHRLVTIQELSSWIKTAEKTGNAHELFTDDLLSINLDYRDLLERFAEFVKYVFSV